VSFGGLVTEAERTHPLVLRSPFEGEDCVSGAVWDARDLIDDRSTDGIVKLCFEAGATTLPMHTHEVSARFIIVLEGRGFYHASDEPLGRFTGKQVRTIAVRERDAVLFTGGVVHTFSAFGSPLVLLSYHSPFIPLEDPRQYTLPEVRWTAKQALRPGDARVTIDNAWSVLACALRDEGGGV
jgi:quercetin dioxygenase-like cupin family protein